MIAESLNGGDPVALGFECPLFVPLVEDELDLTRARPSEGSRPWSAGAGCSALATGLVQVAWVLRSVRSALDRNCTAYLDWGSFVRAEAGLFIWEAFVSGAGKETSHVADAQAAGEAFAQALPDPKAFNSVVCKTPVYSLVGAALLRTGWASSPEVLAEPCLVLKASANTA